MGNNWKLIDGYAGKYEVSDGGDIRNKRTGRAVFWQLRGWGVSDGGGYATVQLYKDKKQWLVEGGKRRRGHQVGQLVLGAFVGPRPRGMKVGYKDGDIENLAVGNLEYMPHGGQFKQSSESQKAEAEERKRASEADRKHGNIDG